MPVPNCNVPAEFTASGPVPEIVPASVRVFPAAMVAFTPAVVTETGADRVIAGGHRNSRGSASVIKSQNRTNSALADRVRNRTLECQAADADILAESHDLRSADGVTKRRRAPGPSGRTLFCQFDGAYPASTGQVLPAVRRAGDTAKHKFFADSGVRMAGRQIK